MHRDVSLHGYGDGHEDGSCHHDHLSRVEEVGEQEDVKLSLQLQVFAETLQDGPEEVARVKEGQSNQ